MKRKPAATETTTGAEAAELLQAAAAQVRAQAEGAGSDGAALVYIAEKIDWCLDQLRKVETV